MENIKIEWSSEINELYEKIIAQIPEMFRSMVAPLLYKTAEEKCFDRNSAKINESDLVTALLEITPEPFKPGTIDNLENLGIDIQKYIKSTDLILLQEDIIKAANIADVPYDENIIHNILAKYKDVFSKHSVIFRTTTKPKGKRKLSVRCLNVPRDPYPTAISEHFITRDDVLDNLYPELKSRFPIFEYGIDMDVEYGLSKIWLVLIPQPIEEIYSLGSMPKSIVNHADYFSKYGFGTIDGLGLDFRNKTMNLYFLENPGNFKPDEIAEMIGDIGLRVPSQEILEYCSRCIPIYFTFSWDSNKIERLCFGVFTLDSSQIPTHLHPLIGDYIKQAPFLSKKHNFVYSFTFARTIDDYVKIENEYIGSVIEHMYRSHERK